MEGLNKKGQGLPITALVLIVIGIVVAVVIIVGFLYGWDKLFGPTKQLPTTLQVKVEACKQFAQQKLTVDYCTKFDEVEIDGKKQAVTCSYLETQKYLSGATLTCPPEIKANPAKYCENTQKGDDYLVDGKDCKTLR